MKYGTFLTAILFVVLTTVQCSTTEQRTFPVDEIQALTDEFGGDAGIYLEDLVTGEVFEIHSDTLFPTASTVKIPILLGIFDKIEKGELTYNQAVAYDGEHDYTWSTDIINQLEMGAEVELSKLVHLMMSTSNNTASLWCQHLAGTGTEINRLMENLGFEHTRVNSRTEGRQDAYDQYGWGQTTPRELAKLVHQIYRGEMISPAASEQMYRIMTRNYWDGEALSEIPPHIQVASKNGAVSRAKSEVLLVHAPSGDYLLSVMTKNEEDEGYDDDNEGFQFLRDVSRIVYRHFEPQEEWEPVR